MRVLLTGHKGYIGSVLTPLLLEHGHEVVGLDTDWFRRCDFGGAPPSVLEQRKDIRDVEYADLEGFDAVIHLAALSNDPLGDLRPSLTYDINFHASVRLAELAREAGVRRFLFSSSCSTYGAAGDDLVDENAEFNPVTPYGKSKVMVERELTRLARDDFSPTFLRNATAYGYSPRIRFDLVLNNLVAWAYTTGWVHLKSDGSPWRPVVHVEDIARAFVTVLESPRERVHARPFNVGATSENYRIKELAEIVRDVVPNARVRFADGASPDERTYRVDCSRIGEELSYETRWTARRGAEQLLERYRAEELEEDEFESPRYKRLSHIQKLIDEDRLDWSLEWTATREARLAG